MISFTLPAPPSVNNLFANVPGKGRVRSDRYRAWANAAGWTIKAHGPLQPVMWGRVSVSILTGNVRQDIDNGTKAILDLLVDMAVIADDKQVGELIIRRGGKPREAVVTVTPL